MTPSTDPCILELRARVMALEAQAGNLKGSLTSSTPPPVATDEELRDRATNALATPPPEPTPEPPTDDELMALAVAVFEDPYATDKDYARAVLERWGHG